MMANSVSNSSGSQSVDWKMIEEERKLVKRACTDKEPDLSEEEMRNFASNDLKQRYLNKYGPDANGRIRGSFGRAMDNIGDAIYSVIKEGNGKDGYHLEEFRKISISRWPHALLGSVYIEAKNKLPETEIEALKKNILTELNKHGVNVTEHDIEIKRFVNKVYSKQENGTFEITDSYQYLIKFPSSPCGNSVLVS